MTSTKMKAKEEKKETERKLNIGSSGNQLLIISLLYQLINAIRESITLNGSFEIQMETQIFRLYFDKKKKDFQINPIQ